LKQILAALAFVSLLGGCAHVITVTPLDGGIPGHGTAPPTIVRNDGMLTILLDGKSYEGEYVYVPEGGFVGVGSGFYSGSVAVLGSPMSGGGRANLRASDGSTLRCEFHYSSFSATGIGGCEDGKGRKFDMTIK
jgi:hypothetical protein